MQFLKKLAEERRRKVGTRSRRRVRRVGGGGQGSLGEVYKRSGIGEMTQNNEKATGKRQNRGRVPNG